MKIQIELWPYYVRDRVFAPGTTSKARRRIQRQHHKKQRAFGRETIRRETDQFFRDEIESQYNIWALSQHDAWDHCEDYYPVDHCAEDYDPVDHCEEDYDPVDRDDYLYEPNYDDLYERHESPYGRPERPTVTVWVQTPHRNLFIEVANHDDAKWLARQLKGEYVNTDIFS